MQFQGHQVLDRDAAERALRQRPRTRQRARAGVAGGIAGIPEVHDLDPVVRPAMVVPCRVDRDDAAQRVLVIRQPQGRGQRPFAQFPCQCGEFHARVEDARKVDVLGSSRVAVHRQRTRADQCRLEAELPRDLGDPFSEGDRSRGIEHVRPTGADTGRAGPTRARGTGARAAIAGPAWRAPALGRRVGKRSIGTVSGAGATPSRPTSAPLRACRSVDVTGWRERNPVLRDTSDDTQGGISAANAMPARDEKRSRAGRPPVISVPQRRRAAGRATAAPPGPPG